MSRKKPQAITERPHQSIHTKHYGGHLIAKPIGRNEPCPCGSGKKAKNCCGAVTKYYAVEPKLIPKESKFQEKIKDITESPKIEKDENL